MMGKVILWTVKKRKDVINVAMCKISLHQTQYCVTGTSKIVFQTHVNDTEPQTFSNIS